MRSKVTIVGAGQTGGAMARELAPKGIADIVLLDIVGGHTAGEGAGHVAGGAARRLRLQDRRDERLEGHGGLGHHHHHVGQAAPAGHEPRRPGDGEHGDRQVGDVQQAIAQSPNAIIIVFVNPLDVMCYVARRSAASPASASSGSRACWTRRASGRSSRASSTCRSEDVQAYVLGGHGDDMVPLVRHTTVCGIPISELMPADRIAALVERTRKGGGEIVNLLKTGSAYYAPAAATIQMVESVLLDRKRVMPCSVYLEGEFGVSGIFMGVPVKLGARGIEQIIEIKLTDDEREMFERSAASVREVTKVTGL